MTEERRARITELARQYFHIQQRIQELLSAQHSEENEIAYHLASAEKDEIRTQLDIAKRPEEKAS